MGTLKNGKKKKEKDESTIQLGQKYKCFSYEALLQPQTYSTLQPQRPQQ